MQDYQAINQEEPVISVKKPSRFPSVFKIVGVLALLIVLGVIGYYSFGTKTTKKSHMLSKQYYDTIQEGKKLERTKENAALIRSKLDKLRPYRLPKSSTGSVTGVVTDTNKDKKIKKLADIHDDSTNIVEMTNTIEIQDGWYVAIQSIYGGYYCLSDDDFTIELSCEFLGTRCIYEVSDEDLNYYTFLNLYNNEYLDTYYDYLTTYEDVDPYVMFEHIISLSDYDEDSSYRMWYTYLRSYWEYYCFDATADTCEEDIIYTNTDACDESNSYLRFDVIST